MEKNYQLDESRVFGFKPEQSDPDAPDAVWVAVISADRDACESPESKIDCLRYVTSRGQSPGSSIDRSSGPHLDSGQTAPVGTGLDPSNSGMMGQDQYLAMIAKSKFSESRGEAKRFVMFHRVRRADLI